MSRRGLTIVELLIVIGIIAVLVGLITAATIGARRKANTAVCASNLRQLGVGMQMYAQEFSGQVLRMPGSLPVDPNNYMSWAEGYRRYLDPDWGRKGRGLETFKLTKCPEHPLQWAESNFSVNAVNLGVDSVDGTMKNLVSKLSRVVNPSGVPYLVDSADRFRVIPEQPHVDVTTLIGSHVVRSAAYLPGGSSPRVASSRHGSNYINCLFFDGHVDLITTKRMTLEMWDDGIR